MASDKTDAGATSMNDIAALIERAREAARWAEAENDHLSEGIFNEMIDALSRLAAEITDTRDKMSVIGKMLQDLCSHLVDEQAACCVKCGAHAEDIR